MNNNLKALIITAAALILQGCSLVPEQGSTEVNTDSISMQVESELKTDNTGEAQNEDTSVDVTVDDTSIAETTESEIASEEPSEEPVPESADVDVSLIMVGDLLMHDNISQSGYLADGTINYDHIFANVKDDIEAADVAVVNNEVIYGGDDRGYQNYPLFNVLTQLGDSVVNAGFDVVLHASNHVLDQGVSGIENCLDFWSTKHPETAVLGIHASEEAASDIYVYEKDGLRIAMLNYTYDMNGMTLPSDKKYMVDTMTENTKDKIISDIRHAHEIADAVIVFPHWGTEYNLGSDDFQHRWAQLFADEGVLAVIGDHPHVVEPVEWYTGSAGNQMLCYYSVGNFISSQTGADSMLGIMAKLNIHKSANSGVTISYYGVEPLVTHRRSGPGNFTTYRLSDYTQELVSQNSILNYDGRFSISYLQDLCEKEFGELYTRPVSDEE